MKTALLTLALIAALGTATVVQIKEVDIIEEAAPSKSSLTQKIPEVAKVYISEFEINLNELLDWQVNIEKPTIT